MHMHAVNHLPERLQAAVPAVVVLRVLRARAFDGIAPGCSYGTGFVVDRRQGIILTNRHVISTGPVRVDVMFHSGEELEGTVLYVDPLHDFAFVRFDASAPVFEVGEIELDPDSVQVGQEICVLGCVDGPIAHKGVLTSLEREPPNYDMIVYNDCNATYFSSTALVSWGASGAPVLSNSGRAVALHCGNTASPASSVHLSLSCVVYALQCLQQHLPVRRGCIQTVLRRVPAADSHRVALELQSAMETMFELQKFQQLAHARQFVVVDQVLPRGPADGLLAPGAIMLGIAGRQCSSFEIWEDALNNHVGCDIICEVWVAGGYQKLIVPVQDMHDTAPHEFLDLNGGVLHRLSFQQARNYHMPLQQVYIAAAPFMFGREGIKHHSVLVSIADFEISSLKDVQRALASVEHGETVLVKHTPLKDKYHARGTFVEVDKGWFWQRMFKRASSIGAWDVEPSDDCSEDSSSSRRGQWETACLSRKRTLKAIMPPLKVRLTELPEREIFRSLVSVRFDTPYPIDGLSTTSAAGTGVIVNAGLGLVVVAKTTVPQSFGAVKVTFQGVVELSAVVKFVHPQLNFSIIQYDPSDPSLLGVEIASALIRAKGGSATVGMAVHYAGLAADHHASMAQTYVTRVDQPAAVTSGRSVLRSMCMNTNLISVAPITQPSSGGVLMNQDLEVFALWAAFPAGVDRKVCFRGLSFSVIMPFLQHVLEKPSQDVSCLPFQLGTVRLARVRAASSHLLELQHRETGQAARQVNALVVQSCSPRSKAAAQISPGDIILSMNGVMLSSFDDVWKIIQPTDSTVRLRFIRGRREMTAVVELSRVPSNGVRKLLQWAGMLLHDSFVAPLEYGQPSRGVHVSRWFYGSPAHKAGVCASYCITAVNDYPVTDLEAMLDVLECLENNATVRLSVVDGQGRHHTMALQTDELLWPAAVHELVGDEWRLNQVQMPDTTSQLLFAPCAL